MMVIHQTKSWHRPFQGCFLFNFLFLEVRSNRPTLGVWSKLKVRHRNVHTSIIFGASFKIY